MTPDGRGKTGARVRVGVAGWYYPDWQGIVYPSGETFDQLGFLAGFVDVIEINTTFYRPPEREKVLAWCDRVSSIEGFAFTVKLWQRFTHARAEGRRLAELDDFLRRIRPIFDRGLGGALLAQFPHSFHRTDENTAYLRNLLEQIGGFPIVVEMRHASWGDAEALALLDGLGAGVCAIDQPMFRSSLEPIERVVGGLAYIRLHGRNKGAWFREDAGRDERYDYLYSSSELGPWVERARAMAGQAREVYVIANNHFRGQAVCNALMFKSMLLGERVRAPARLIEGFPPLAEYADPDAPVQGTLF